MKRKVKVDRCKDCKCEIVDPIDRATFDSWGYCDSCWLFSEGDMDRTLKKMAKEREAKKVKHE